jgi:hypothetical protein
MLVQIGGGCLGALFAHLMFGLDPIQLATKAGRLSVRLLHHLGYWFMASTSFINPGRDNRAIAERHLRRHLARGRAGLHRGAARAPRICATREW